MSKFPTIINKKRFLAYIIQWDEYRYITRTVFWKGIKNLLIYRNKVISMKV